MAAERILFGIAPDGSGHEVRLQIGVPEPQAAGDWMAPVSLAPLQRRALGIFGVDAWQATSLAMRFIAGRVCDFSDKGWRFYWKQGGTLISTSELFRDERPI